MAEAFLQIVLENLNSLILGEIGLIMGIEDEMEKLSSTLTTIQAVLEDAEEKQLQSKPIRNWLCKINDLAYEIDDILDECATHVSELKHKNSKLSHYSLKKILFRHNIGRRIKKVTDKLDEVAAERAKFHLREMPIQRSREVAATRETISIVDEPHLVYGRDKDKEKIVDILVNQVRENQEISILPIIGIGGLGKTTLAQLVFKDQRVVEHFQEKLWVCVSDNFDVKTLVKAMLESATGRGSASDLQHLDTLQMNLRMLLSQKRYLLVLDDVWNDHQEKWFELRKILACGSAGASIILTTRLIKVAHIMGTLPAHNLAGLSEEHCWMLLRQRAFGQEKELRPNLEAIGKQIVKKCAGVPLAAKALGGILRFKRTEEEWVYVKESEIWNLSPEEHLILPALRLSYHHLPLSLRQCFAYCAVFPKDTIIEKKALVFLWMAHGYISSKGTLEVEDVGNEICDELVLRSLLQHTSHVNSGGFKRDTITMHDLVHDLAQSIMESKVPGKQVETNITNAYKIRQVHLRNKYVVFLGSNQLYMDVTSVLMKFSRLRVLDARLSTIQDLPYKVGHLKHLRYLNLEGSEIRTLPNSLCSLRNLLIFNLNHCESLMALPKNMRYLINLRHLCLEGCTSLSEMPSKIRELTCLKTLSLFIVGVNRGNQLDELQKLNLGGKLEIRHLERVKSHMDAKKANLAQKKNLRHLSLEWECSSRSTSGEDIDERVLEALEPHPNVEALEIRGFRGQSFPVWMSKPSMGKIVRIEIADCSNCLHLPQFGRLRHLKELRLRNLAVEYIIEDECGNDPVNIQFPSLEKLELRHLANLKGFSKEQVIAEAFPNLLNLTIVSCSSLILPQLSSLQKLKQLECSSSTLPLFSKLDTLTDLDVEIDENMKCIPIETLDKLTNLEELRIYEAQEISVPEDGLRALKSLRRLDILSSETLTCLPQGWLQHLAALKCLSIISCSEFVELPEKIEHLQNLEMVQLCNLPKMVCLPKALQHLSSSLKSLILTSLPQLNSLPHWLGDFSSLEYLDIYDCPKLVSLPASIREMPSLQDLSVRKCPELERRCQRGTGEDWHKIAHIPHLHIG